MCVLHQSSELIREQVVLLMPPVIIWKAKCYYRLCPPAQAEIPSYMSLAVENTLRSCFILASTLKLL